MQDLLVDAGSVVEETWEGSEVQEASWSRYAANKSANLGQRPVTQGSGRGRMTIPCTRVEGGGRGRNPECTRGLEAWIADDQPQMMPRIAAAKTSKTD